MANKTSTPQRTKKRWEIGEWLNLPEGPPFYELEVSRLVEMSSPRVQQQKLVFKLAGLLDEWMTRHRLEDVMAVDVALPTGRGYIPDLVFICRERECELLAPDGKVHGMPEWVWSIDSEDLSIEEFKWTLEGRLRTVDAISGEVFRAKSLFGFENKLRRTLGKNHNPSK